MSDRALDVAVNIVSAWLNEIEDTLPASAQTQLEDRIAAAIRARSLAMSDRAKETCDHPAGRRLRPMVLATWCEGDLVITRYAMMACSACGVRWTEET